jgi:phage gp45-like
MPHRLAETIQELRGTAMRGLVLAVDDTGDVQTVDVQTHDGMLRAGIEVFQPYGVATCAPSVGSVVQLAAIGADPGDLIALPPVCPAARYGGLQSGEVVLYDAGGDRVALRQGGTVEVLGATSILIAVGTMSIVVTQGSITIDGATLIVPDLPQAEPPNPNQVWNPGGAGPLAITPPSG